ncbi:puratrophin-1 isoform X2 [Toxotes jaculatrix]|uniref:puratrophin-1 isoform X1 n=1 Tax=Toxotes jaculatrix TaxID=941984 RepID=UPI001B3AB91B|nr:puratrophin-1 isoform X1 [Toxotes jaculatrix]XP_040908457.1 puratrophin-1 isoform X2 [Toxotes jaculatrix]
MDSESLDRCIQTTLSALYPPFQATSSTVLCQVLNVVDSCYRGDGLRYLLHFLLPAKHFLQNLQQHACLQYCGWLFCHEGWPLCIHEKIVVQLCPLDQRLLRPGDFYLLVSPAAPPPPRTHSASCRSSVTSSPRLLLCSVSAGSHHVEQQEVSEIALRSLFSMAWLDSVNRERERRGASRLERCLLSANGDVFRVPWEDLVYPQFISRPRTTLKEDKESSVKDGDMLINTSHNLCTDTKPSRQEDVKLLPSASKTNQSPASSEAEDSEGEYVELTELPLPRFSPQKGSLTQSISLQHRARTSTDTSAHTAPTTHTPRNTNTLSAQSTHTRHNKPTNTHPVSITPNPVEVSAHTRLCSKLIKENLSQDSCRPVILTPVSPATPSSSSAPPEVMGTSSGESEHRTSQEQTEGTDSDRCVKVYTEPEKNCREQREEEVEEKGEEERGKEGEVEEKREEGERMERQMRKHEMVVSVDEGVVEEVKQLEETVFRRDEDLLPHTQTAEEGGEMEEQDGSEVTEGEGEEELDDEGVDEAEEVEVEEEVQVIIVQQNQERREEKQVMKEDEREGGKEKDEEEEEGKETHTDKEADSCINTHSEDSYSENNTQHTRSMDSYSENNTMQTHSEDSYSENNALQTHLGDSYSENNTQHTRSMDSYSESKTLQTHLEDSYSENNTPQTHLEDSYSENNTLQTHLEDSNKQHTNSYSENITQHTHSEDSYSENTKPPTHSEDSEESNTPPSVSSPAMDPESLWTEPEESERGQREQDEEDEEDEDDCSCEEVGGGRAAELQTEGVMGEPPPVQSGVSLSTGLSPTEPEQPEPSPQLDQSGAPTVPPEQVTQSSQSSQSSFYSVLLSSGALCLPGTRDRSGRALLTVCTRSSIWSNPDCDGAELLRLLLYYTSTLRKEVRALGLTVLVDARGAAPVPALFSALSSLQENIPGSIHTVLLLINKDSTCPRVDKPAATQVEVLSSLKSLQKVVELQQLPAELGGSFSFRQSSWLSFRSRVEQLTNQCEDVISLLQKTINVLQCTPLPAAAEDAELLLSKYKAVMRSILEDRRLVRLQQEGGASLSRLRREESGISGTEEYRTEVETVSSLYDQVDELLHRLVTLSNSRTQELNFILDFRSLEQGFTEVRSWLEDVGEVHLKTLEEPEDSLELLNKKQQDFKDFYTTAYEHCKRGQALLGRLERWGDVSSSDLHIYEVKVRAFWAQLQDFSQRVNATGQNIDRAVRLYRFLDEAYGWALEGMRHLAGVSMEDCTLPGKCQAVIGCLEDYQRQHPPIPDARFQEMKAAVEELRGEQGLRQWSFAWSKCQETKKMFDRKMEAALRTRDSSQRRCSESALSRNPASSRKTLSGLWGLCETPSSSSSCPPEEDTNTSSPPRNSSSLLPLTSSPITSTPAPSISFSHTPQHTPLLHRLFRSASSEESSDRVDICSSSPSLPRLDSSASFTPSSACSSSSSFSSSRRQQLRKTQSFDCPSTPEASRYGPCPRALSEPVRRGNTGVFIRGLEVSSTEAADHTLCPRTAAHGWAGQGLRSPRTPGTPRTTSRPAADPQPRGSKLRHIVEEMVTTEQEYVRSLRYIIHHYFPEMDRVDVPQDLRGKRSVVFGNLEKLLDFHSQFFLRELEACWKHPLRVPHCFLRHQEQFGLYALYSKNKPKSDALLSNHGNSFFRRKQVELGDKMDLSSYLLKPIQRMSKYALLLTDLIKEVGVAQEAELAALQAATNMVKFQLRHGNDLLAMDAIRDCDVNLKEQGQLIRQDEFTVWTGRRKCQRHIFLFEELVLFSKPRKMEGGLDVFIYKHSFKTADVGLTESTGDSGLRFEIWFRRRTSKNQTFILQAATPDVKHAWTSDIARILWTQATRNKEMRLKEMVSMGVGNKPFLDIQPSDAAISDRAVHYIMKSRGARTRASIAVSVFDHSNPFKRGAVTSDPSTSGPSSSSLLGPLNLHMYSQTLPPSPAAESSFITSCIEEDEQEHETSSQPSMTTESSGSSSRCLSGSTGSDSGCVSSHLQEPLPEEPSTPGQPSSSSSSSSNKQRLSRQYISAKSAPVISPATVV